MILTKVFNKINFYRLYFYGAIIYAFFIPLSQKAASLTIVIWAVLSLINYNKRAINRTNYLFTLPLLYSTYILGVVVSGTESLTFLEHKLSFLIFPLIFFLHSYTIKDMEKVLKYFIYGLLLSGWICLALAFYRSLIMENGSILFKPNILMGKGFFESIIYGGNHFFGNHLTIYHQTVYYSMYLCAGISILLYKSDIFDRKYRIAFIAFFALIIFLVSNKAGFLTLALIFGIHILYLPASIFKKVSILSLLFVTIVLFALTNPRIRESIRKVSNGELVINKNARYGFAIRVLSWDTAISLISEKPILGYGAGNAQNKLNKAYLERGYNYPLKEKLNAHNQFLQIWLENGILGILSLSLIFICLAGVLGKAKVDSQFLLMIMAILFLNSLFESIFNRFSGVSFFSFWVCFIFSLYKERGGKV